MHSLVTKVYLLKGYCPSDSYCTIYLRARGHQDGTSANLVVFAWLDSLGKLVTLELFCICVTCGSWCVYRTARKHLCCLWYYEYLFTLQLLEMQNYLGCHHAVTDHIHMCCYVKTVIISFISDHVYTFWCHDVTTCYIWYHALYEITADLGI